MSNVLCGSFRAQLYLILNRSFDIPLRIGARQVARPARHIPPKTDSNVGTPLPGSAAADRIQAGLNKAGIPQDATFASVTLEHDFSRKPCNSRPSGRY